MFRILGPKGGVIVRSATLARVHSLLPRLRRRFGKVTVVKIVRSSKPATMYDSVNLDQIPANAPAVAGYVGGRWSTFPQLAVRWPKARRVSIAVSARENAMMLDIEPRDATNDQAAAWFRRQKKRGVKKPMFYTSLSNVDALVAVLHAAGIGRDEFILGVAHYTFRPHICTRSCGLRSAIVADGTQFTDKSKGRNLDEWLLRRSFWS